MGIPASAPALSRPLSEWLTEENPQDGSGSAAAPQQKAGRPSAPRRLPRPLDSGLAGNPMDADESDVGPTPRAAPPCPWQARRWKEDTATTQGQSDAGSSH
jgi:hypothetical protein